MIESLVINIEEWKHNYINKEVDNKQKGKFKIEINVLNIAVGGRMIKMYLNVHK